jgi:hypothetical protein
MKIKDFGFMTIGSGLIIGLVLVSEKIMTFGF